MTSRVALSAEQTAGIEEIKKWHEDALDGMRGAFLLVGPAGTGKTTMAKEIPGALGVTAKFMTFTGKAAHVLTRKGAPAKTIHSSIYYPLADEEAKARLAAARKELAALDTTGDGDTGNSAQATLEAEIKDLEARARRMSWEWNPEAMNVNPGLLILDEVSMVNGRLAEDIERYNIPVLVLGDQAQLPPVEGGGHYINRTPDYMLEEIHRQALDSPVLEMATRIRLSQGAALGLTNKDMEAGSIAKMMEATQVIVWSNKRRWAMIDIMRKKAGRELGVPSAGDRIMCLTNNKDLAVFNGAQFTVLDSTPTPLGPTLRLLDDDGHERVIPTFSEGYQGLDKERGAKNAGAGIKGGRMLATFSQAITCHKSQGSEWDSVYVVNELPNMMSMVTRKEGIRAAEAQARQWLYTAVTRAAKEVTITTPKRGA